MLHQTFTNGGFVVAQSLRRGSGIPMDQALEKQYNKPAKGPTGIMGFSRRKEAVCKWNIIKQEKGLYTNFMHKLCGFDTNDEYSIHHEFSPSITKRDQEAVEQMMEYIQERGIFFDIDQSSNTNISTGVQLDRKASVFFLGCIEKGEEEYLKFKSARLENKTQKLFDSIPKVRKRKAKTNGSSSGDLEKETVSFLRYIDYARLRQYEIRQLLQFEITSTSFLLTKDGFLRKSQKSELTKEIKKLLPTLCPDVVPADSKPSLIVFDFMGYCPLKKWT